MIKKMYLKKNCKIRKQFNQFVSKEEGSCGAKSWKTRKRTKEIVSRVYCFTD